MKSSNLVRIVLAALLLSSTAFAGPNPILECVVKDGDTIPLRHKFESADRTTVQPLGAPIFIQYIDKTGVERTAQLNVAFGSPQRILQATWAEGQFTHPDGYSFRPVVSTLRAQLAPGKVVEFQFGDDEFSVNPAITLSCRIAPAAKKYKPTPDCNDCEGGGGSASN